MTVIAKEADQRIMELLGTIDVVQFGMCLLLMHEAIEESDVLKGRGI